MFEAWSARVWIALNLIDLVTTATAIERGLVEGNVIMRWFVGNTAALVGYKVVLSIGVIFLLAWLKRSYLLKWLNIALGVVVVWNLIWVLL